MLLVTSLYFSACFIILQRNQILAQKILRHTEASCFSMEPQYVQEVYPDLNLGPEYVHELSQNNHVVSATEPNDGVIFQAPNKLNSGTSAFDIRLDFEEYRLGRLYKVQILALEFFDSFMIQARGPFLPDGNSSFVGSFVQVPHVAKLISCGNSSTATVVDKGRPIQLGNLTFSWKAPDYNAGPVRFLVSIAFGGAFVHFDSNQIRYGNIPITITGCGIRMSCFRYCFSSIPCSDGEADFLITMQAIKLGSTFSPTTAATPSTSSLAAMPPTDLEFVIGGYFKAFAQLNNYVAIGFGSDYSGLSNMDIVACHREGSSMIVEHFLLEDKTTTPFVHRQNVRLDDSGLDPLTDFGWCKFSRPISPQTALDLDFRRRMYQFYLWGNKTYDNSLSLSLDNVQISNAMINVSEYIFDEVRNNSETLRSPTWMRLALAVAVCSLIQLTFFTV